MHDVVSIKLSEAERLKELLYQSINSPGLNPANTFILLATLLDREFSDEDAPNRFVKFVRDPHPTGLGMNPLELEKIISDLKHPHEVGPQRDQKIVDRMNSMRQRVRELVMTDLERAATRQEAGAKGGRGNKASDNITSFRGTDPTYILKRLKRDRPDLADKVIAGELSANAAAIEAGFRKKPTAFELVFRLLPKLTDEQLDAVWEYLQARK